MTALEPFDGLPVLGTAIALTNAGDGLSQAMKTEPTEFHSAQTVFIVVEAEVTNINHKRAVKDDPEVGWTRVHSLKAGVATIVDRSLVIAALDAQRSKNEAAADRALGVSRLPGTAPDLDAYNDDGLDDPESYEPDEIPALAAVPDAGGA